MLAEYLDLLIILDRVISQISSIESTSDDLHSDPELFAEPFHQRVLLLLLDLSELLVRVANTSVTRVYHRLSPRMNLQSLLIEFCCSRSLRATSMADLVMPNWMSGEHHGHGGSDDVFLLRVELHRDEVRQSLRWHEVLVAVCSFQSSVVQLDSEACRGSVIERQHIHFFIELPHMVHRRYI